MGATEPATHRRLLRLGPRERPPAVDALDQAALAENLHRPPDRPVGDPVLGSEIPLGWHPSLELAPADPGGKVVRHLEVGKDRRVGVNHEVILKAALTCRIDAVAVECIRVL